MKFFCYILSIYIISLLAYPCHDKSDHLNTYKTEKSTDQNHNEQECHTCSPFCSCSCCNVNTIVTVKAGIKTAETVSALPVSIYKETSIKDIILSIWQPPKA